MYELTDAGNAARFVYANGDVVRYAPGWGWMFFDGKRWTKEELQVRKLAVGTARRIHAEAASEPDQARQKAITSWARQSQSANRIQGLLWIAQSDLVAQTSDFDSNPWLLPVNNGTLDLQAGRLLPHLREHYCTRLSPVDFDPTALCPLFLDFLARVIPDPAVRALLQRLVGYSLTGNTSEQVLVFLYGCGRNGKSVAVELIAEMMGDYHIATRIETLSTTRGGSIPNDVAALAGARFVTVSETPEGSRMNESLIKDLTGGDTITARFLRHEFFQFRPQFKIWIRGNHKPQIRGTDDGIWRRLIMVPFVVQIPVSEVDPLLPQKLRAELSGILNWALEGCRLWQEDGLRIPESVTKALADYRMEMDTLGEFIADRCYLSDSARAPASMLYAVYRSWCEGSGHSPVSTTRFGTTLAERGFEKHKPKTVVWHGIGLLSDSPTVADTSPSSSDTRARTAVYAKKGAQLSEVSEREEF